jgi:hypothetical protein
LITVLGWVDQGLGIRVHPAQTGATTRKHTPTPMVTCRRTPLNTQHRCTLHRTHNHCAHTHCPHARAHTAHAHAPCTRPQSMHKTAHQCSTQHAPAVVVPKILVDHVSALHRHLGPRRPPVERPPRRPGLGLGAQRARRGAARPPGARAVVPILVVRLRAGRGAVCATTGGGRGRRGGAGRGGPRRSPPAAGRRPPPPASARAPRAGRPARRRRCQRQGRAPRPCGGPRGAATPAGRAARGARRAGPARAFLALSWCVTSRQRQPRG